MVADDIGGEEECSAARLRLRKEVAGGDCDPLEQVETGAGFEDKERDDHLEAETHDDLSDLNR